MSTIAKATPSVSATGMPVMPTRGTLSYLEIGLLGVCAGVVLLGLSESLMDVVALSFLWGGLALAWNLAGGYGGMISFGHAAFFGIGAYGSTILNVHYGLTPWAGIWIGAAIAAAVGATLALICARLRGPFFILSTLAIAEVVRIGALNWVSVTGGPEGLSIPPVSAFVNMVFASKQTYAVLMLAYLVGMYVLTKVIEASRYGFYLSAVRDDEDAASAAGINPLVIRTSVMGTSAFFTAVGGSIFAQYFLYLDPTHIFGVELSFQFALLPALGGLGTAIGPVLGAFAITPLSELLRSYLGGAAAGLHLAIYGAVVIVVMLYFPGGLADALNRIVSRLGRSRT